MRVYADTNFLTALYCSGPHGQEALSLHQRVLIEEIAIPVTMLGRLEFINALQQCVFSTRHGVPGIRLTIEMALALESMFFEDMARGRWFEERSPDDGRLEEIFQTLSHRHTASEGFRTYDLLHVSSAIAMECDTFWSFDRKAKRLASLEGLKVN